MTQIERPIADAGIRLQGDGDPVRAAGDDFPVFDRDILAVVCRPQSRQQLPERSPLTFSGAFRGLDERKAGRGILDYLTHGFPPRRLGMRCS